MRTFKTLLPVVLCASYAALGVNSCDHPGPNPNPSGSCKVTLSGALSGTYDCTSFVSLGWSSSNNVGAFGISVAGSGATDSPRIDLTVGFAGEPQAMTCTSGEAGIYGSAIIMAGGHYYGATVDKNDSSHDQGSFSLDLTSVTTEATVSSGKIYKTSGTYDAAAPALSGTGATGEVMVTVDF